MAMVCVMQGAPVAVFIDASISHLVSAQPQYLDPGLDEQVGDFVLAFASMIDTTDILAMPSGWTLERYDINADGRFGTSRSYVWSRILSSGDISGGAYLGPFTVNRNSTWTLAGMHYRGPTTVAVDSATVYGTSDGTSTTFDAPSVAAPSSGVLVAAYQLDDSPSGSGPGSMTERVNHVGASGFTSQSIYDETVPSGATGIRSRTRTVSRAGVAVSLLLT